jgi:hypothetical protein
MSKLLEHINQMGPEIGDLMVDQPETHRWLPMPVVPVLSTPVCIPGIMFVIAASGCLTGSSDKPCR